jgi:RNA polymerase sigma factor (sigma-70 family)
MDAALRSGEFISVVKSASNSKTRATLLERLQNGHDALVWDEFFERYWRLIYAYARRCNCSEHTAEEVVQDVMLKVFEQKEFFQYDPARGRFRDWLGTVVRNKVAEIRRKPSERIRAMGGDSNTVCLELQSDNDSPDDLWGSAFEEALLIVLLDVVRREMTPRAYLAFELFTIHNMPGGKVAQHTGLTRNGVYRAHKRAIQRLKELGAGYRDDGQLCESIKQAMQSRPPAAIEQTMTNRGIRD